MPLGACLAAGAAAKAGHRVGLVDLMYAKDPLQQLKQGLKSIRPDVIGLSIRNIDNNNMRDPVAYYPDLIPILDTIRNNSEAPVVLGGPAVPILPEQYLRLTGALAAVTGDGETVFPRLLSAISNNEPMDRVEGIAFLEDGDFQLNNPSAQEVPDFSPLSVIDGWIDLKAYRSRSATVPVQTKRGCPYSCIYCTYPCIEGTGYRLAHPEEVAETIKRLVRLGLRDIEFVDNVFNSPYEHALAICERIAAARLRARIQTVELSPLFIDEALLFAMEAAGFVGIGITAESSSDIVLGRLCKGFTAGDVHRAAQAVNRHAIPCLWIFMLGGPGETEETVRETLDFAGRNIRRSDAVFFSLGIRIYPGTELEKIARREGILQCPAAEMLAPVFYLSPALDRKRTENMLCQAVREHSNYFSSDSFNLPLLSAINRVGHFIGVKPPLWTKTRNIRRLLKLLRADL
ncbi:MAG: radical SAM protein [Candidatus Glassbacteria bacterium]